MRRIVQVIMLLAFFLPRISYADVLERPAFTGYVYDYGDVLTSSDETLMNNYARTTEDIGAGQVIVVTVESLSGMTAAEYGLELMNAWGIGRAGINDGLLILLALNERYVQICTGSDIDTQITDDECGLLIDEFALSYLANNEFSKGVMELTKASCLELVFERSALFDDKRMIEKIFNMNEMGNRNILDTEVDTSDDYMDKIKNVYE